MGWGGGPALRGGPAAGRLDASSADCSRAAAAAVAALPLWRLLRCLLAGCAIALYTVVSAGAGALRVRVTRAIPRGVGGGRVGVCCVFFCFFAFGPFACGYVSCLVVNFVDVCDISCLILDYLFYCRIHIYHPESGNSRPTTATLRPDATHPNKGKSNQCSGTGNWGVKTRSLEGEISLSKVCL